MALGFVVAPLAIAVLSIGPWFERAGVASLAAQEGARAAVLADTWPAAVVAARDTAMTIGDARCGLGCLHVEVASTTPGSLTRASKITVTAETTMPGVSIPMLGSVGSFDYAVGHTEAVETYRSLP